MHDHEVPDLCNSIIVRRCPKDYTYLHLVTVMQKLLHFITEKQKVHLAVIFVEARSMVCSCLLFTNQSTVVHHLRFFVKALAFVEVPQVFDSAERGSVLRSPCLLKTGQCTVVHHLHRFGTDNAFLIR